MPEERFWNLLAKKLSGEATEDETRELTSIIKANPELSYSAQTVADLWKLNPPENKSASEKAFQKIQATLELEHKPKAGIITVNKKGTKDKKADSKAHWPAVVAFFLMFVVIAVVVQLNQPRSLKAHSNNQTREIYTRPGTRTKIYLPDSSTVWLNAGSKLSYPLSFDEGERKVTLTGEAFFDVVKDKRPFIIYTNGAQIKVLGTAFNVRSYPSEKRIETSLVHGKVEVVMEKDPGNKYILKPDEKLTLNTELPLAKFTGQSAEQILAVKSTLNHIDEETIAETSWIENKLVFDNESFEDLARRMERWYGVTIQFENEKLKQERFTGVFEKENVWQALDALRYSTSFHYQGQKNAIILITQ